MNVIDVTCAECNRTLRVSADLAGKAIRCPDCKAVVRVRSQATEPPERTSRTDDYDDEPRGPRRRFKARSRGNAVVPWIIAGSAVATAVAAVIIFFVFFNPFRKVEERGPARFFADNGPPAPPPRTRPRFGLPADDGQRPPTAEEAAKTIKKMSEELRQSVEERRQNMIAQFGADKVLIFEIEITNVVWNAATPQEAEENLEPVREFLDRKILAIPEGRTGNRLGTFGQGWYVLFIGPVHDVQKVAPKVDFGKVLGMEGTTIRMTIDKAEIPFPPKDPTGRALWDLQSPTERRRHAALERLANTIPNERRAEVCKELMARITSVEGGALDKAGERSLCINALVEWADKDCVPLFIKLSSERLAGIDVLSCRALGKLKDERGLDCLLEHLRTNTPLDRKEMLKAFAQFPDNERAIDAIASQVGNSFVSHEASQAIIAIGAKAEKAVLKYVQSDKEKVREECCKVLRLIGTKDSVRTLQLLLRDRNADVAQAAKDALAAVQARERP